MVSLGTQDLLQVRIVEDYTEKIFMTQIITNLEPAILECEVKWALGGISTNKAS